MNVIRSLLKIIFYPIDFISYRLYFTFVSKNTSASVLEIDPNNCKKIVILSPHQDDEILGCGALMIKYTGCVEFTIIYVTDGGGNKARRSDADRKNLSAQRRQESNALCSTLGISEPIFLNYEDSRLICQSGITADLTKQINDLKPDIIMAPFISDADFDHMVVTKALSEVDKNVVGAASVLLYQVHSQIPDKFLNRYLTLEKADYLYKRKLLSVFESQLLNRPFVIDKYLNFSRHIPLSIRRTTFVSIERYCSLSFDKFKNIYDDSTIDISRLSKLVKSLNYGWYTFAFFLKNKKILDNLFVKI